MIDFSLFDKALKITWVKRLRSDDSGPWKLIPLSLLSNVGRKLLFQCDYDLKYLCINEHLTKFYRAVLIHWQQLNYTTPKDKKDILNQIIWNNRFLRINQLSVYYRIWNSVGICKLACLVNDLGNIFLSLKAFVQKFKIKCNFLHYCSLLSAIPDQWKKA